MFIDDVTLGAFIAPYKRRL